MTVELLWNIDSCLALKTNLYSSGGAVRDGWWNGGAQKEHKGTEVVSHNVRSEQIRRHGEVGRRKDKRKKRKKMGEDREEKWGEKKGVFVGAYGRVELEYHLPSLQQNQKDINLLITSPPHPVHTKLLILSSSGTQHSPSWTVFKQRILKRPRPQVNSLLGTPPAPQARREELSFG